MKKAYRGILLSCAALLPAVAQAQTSLPATSQTDRTPAPVEGQDAVAAAGAGTAQEPAAASDAGDEIVVSGIRGSYASALQAKRLAVGVTDGISSDGIGRFPDLNVGEAMQRIPGVQINREAESRDATINLRGLPGTYARTTFNGNSFADPILDGSSPLGAFESDIFSSFVVVKSPSAADLPGGLSGNIDLQIQRALARKDGQVSIKSLVGYEELTDAWNPAISATVSKHFFEDRLGVYLTGAYSKQNFRRDTIAFNQYTPLSTTTTPNYLARYGTGSVLFPSDVRQFVKTTKGDRYSIAGGLEYAATDTLTFGLNAIYTRRNYRQANTDILDIDMRAAQTVVNPTGDVFTLPDGNRYVNRYDYSNTRVFASARSEPSQVRALGIYGDVGWKTDDWRLLGTVAYSDARNSLLQTQFDYRVQPATTGTNGTAGSFFSGGADIGGYAFTLTPSPAVTTSAGPFTKISANELRNPRGDVFIVAGSQAIAVNDTKSGQIDLERFVHGDGPIRSIQVGMRYEATHFRSTQFRASVDGVQSQNINSSLVVQSPFAGDFFGGNLNGYLSNWQTLDYDRTYAAVTPVTLAAGQTLTANGLVNDNTNAQVAQLNFALDNDIMSTYAMAKLEQEIAGVTVRGNVGLRYETTDSAISSQQFNAAGRLVPIGYKNNYDEWLPSVLLAADLTEKLILRGAYYKSFVRPQPRQVTPSTTITGSGANYTAVLGNATIQPFRSDSFDVSLEFYNRPGGNFSIAAFTKRIRGLIAPQTDRNALCPTDGGSFGLGPLTLIGDQCLANGSFNGQRIQVVATGNINSPNPITVRGLELSVQQNLDWLPGFLSGFGGGANYAYTQLKGTASNGTAAILPGVSKHTFNLIGYYETDLFGLRLTYNYRSKYDLAAGGTFAGAARQVKARGQLDASASVNVTDWLAITGDAFNITNQRRVEFENSELKPRRVDYDGRTFQAGFRVLF